MSDNESDHAEQQDDEIETVEQQEEVDEESNARPAAVEPQAEELAEPAAQEPSTSQRQHIDLTTPSPPKKRKRNSHGGSAGTGTPVAKVDLDVSEDDDGTMCPICMTSWEMDGEHRLVALKCGHLFGDSCIRRWLQESQRQSSIKVCPQCKSKAATRDIRCLYAKRLRAIDRTEENSMRRELEAERRRVSDLTAELAATKLARTLTDGKLQLLQQNYDRLSQLIRQGMANTPGALADDMGKPTRAELNQLARHRMYMEKNFPIGPDRGCRVLVYSTTCNSLYATQKSAQSLFPGFGVRIIDVPSFRPTQFVHTSTLMVRDMAISESRNILTVASREPRLPTFDIRTRQYTSTFTANEKPVWACCFNHDREDTYLYAGDLNGGVYTFDLRNPASELNVLQSEDNLSPVINIAAIPPGKEFSRGGILVCQLAVLKFYDNEFNCATAMRLNVEGPFLSMSYDMAKDTVLISTRCSTQFSQSRFILGRLTKIDGIPAIKVIITIFGSPATPFMTRPTQMGLIDNTLILGYLQDSKQIMMYDVKREERVQTMPVNDVVYDICPVPTSSGLYMAALTDSHVRVYKVNSTNP